VPIITGVAGDLRRHFRFELIVLLFRLAVANAGGSPIHQRW
jgi:hypothetical protein